MDSALFSPLENPRERASLRFGRPRRHLIFRRLLHRQLTEKLVQWLALHFAASAHTILPADGEPETALRSLRQLAADIIALRRGDLYSRRVALEEQRLALQATQAKEAREEEFWEWTERPDIREHLEEQIEAQLEERRAWHDTLRAAAPEIAPYMPKRPQPSPVLDETLAPAALI